MGRLVLKTIDSPVALRSAAPAWDDLWLRSAAGWPVLRAQSLADWLEHFVPQARFSAVTIQDGDQLVAALPMYRGRVARLLNVGLLPGNCWTPAGDLLLDPQCGQQEVLDLLVAGLSQARWPLLCFDAVDLATDRWKNFLAALARARMKTVVRPRISVGAVEISHAWDEYLSNRSRNHRRDLRKSLARAEAEGPLELRVFANLRPDEVEPLLRLGFEIENRGWKAASGTAVLAEPGVFDFYLRQAKQLAQWGHLQIVVLEHCSRPIAFEYGFSGKGTYYSLKVAYDEAWSRFSPGQLLRWKLLEAMHRDGACRRIDFMGPLTSALSAWATGNYQLSRLIVAPRRVLSRALLTGYTHCWSPLSGLRANSRRAATKNAAQDRTTNKSAPKAGGGPSLQPTPTRQSSSQAARGKGS